MSDTCCNNVNVDPASPHLTPTPTVIKIRSVVSEMKCICTDGHTDVTYTLCVHFTRFVQKSYKHTLTLKKFFAQDKKQKLLNVKYFARVYHLYKVQLQLN